MRTAQSMTGEEWAHYPGEIELMQFLARDCGHRAVIVNIGIGFGTSCLAFYEGNPTATIFGIDIKVCEDAMKYWKEAGARSIYPVIADSQSMDWPWTVDMVLIDGDHARGAVLADYRAWASKARRWIVFHDYRNPVCAEVAPAIEDIMGREPDMVAGFIAAYRVRYGSDTVAS